MKRIVADSTALILLAKCSFLEDVCKLFEIVIPPSVAKETASDELIRNYPDAALIRGLMSRGLIKTEQPGVIDFHFSMSLHRGEKDALRLALKSNEAILATDDGKAIKAARFLNIPFIISPKIVVNLFRLQKMSLKKARQSIEKLGKIGRYSPEIIAESILSLLEKEDGKANDNKDT